MIPDEAANMEEILKQAALKKYGTAWEDLKPEEQELLYKDYEGLEGRNAEDYASGQGAFDKDMTNGIQAGNVYVGSGVGNALAQMGMNYAGKRQMDQSRASSDELSKQKAKAMAIGGGLAAGQQDRMMGMYEKMLNKQVAPPPAAPTGPPVPPAVPNQPPASAAPQGMPPAAPQQQMGGPPMRPGQPGAIPPSPPGAMPGSGQAVPKNKEEWMAYMLRAFQ